MGLPVRAFVPAGRGRVVYADFIQQGEAFAAAWRDGAPRADTAADLHTPTVVTGELDAADAEQLRA